MNKGFLSYIASQFRPLGSTWEASQRIQPAPCAAMLRVNGAAHPTGVGGLH
jgi:hypothetical protein